MLCIIIRNFVTISYIHLIVDETIKSKTPKEQDLKYRNTEEKKEIRKGTN